MAKDLEELTKDTPLKHPGIQARVEASVTRSQAAELGTDELILADIQENARVAGQHLRTSHNAMRGKGMLKNPTYRELEVRLSVALSMVEGVYSEARRRSQM